MTVRKCKWSGCVLPGWAPYSRYCPRHFAQNAISVGQREWARERFCGVLNGFTPYLGDVDWKTNWPREQLVRIATDMVLCGKGHKHTQKCSIGLTVDKIKEVQWRQAQARACEQHPHKWDRYDRTVPMDYEGPGARVVAKTNREGNGLNDDLEKYGS